LYVLQNTRAEYLQGNKMFFFLPVGLQVPVVFHKISDFFCAFIIPTVFRAFDHRESYKNGKNGKVSRKKGERKRKKKTVHFRLVEKRPSRLRSLKRQGIVIPRGGEDTSSLQTSNSRIRCCRVVERIDVRPVYAPSMIRATLFVYLFIAGSREWVQ
jgi:hypothetical protein